MQCIGVIKCVQVLEFLTQFHSFWQGTCFMAFSVATDIQQYFMYKSTKVQFSKDTFHFANEIVNCKIIKLQA